MAESTTPRRRFSVSITGFLVIGFGGLVVLAVAGQLYLGLTGARENTRELLRDKAQATIDAVVEHLDTRLGSVVAQARTLARLVADGELSIENAAFDSFIFGALASTPQVEGMDVIAPDLMVRAYRRDPFAVHVADESHEVDVRETLARVAATRRPVWGEPQADDGQTVIHLRTPLFDPADRFAGALIQSIGISTLSWEAARLADSHEGQITFVLYDRTRVLAHPVLIDRKVKFTGESHLLPTAEELGDGVLAKIWNEDEIELVNVAPMARGKIKGLSFGDKVYIFIYRTLNEYGPKPWTVGTYFDGRHTRTQVRRLVFLGLGGVGILAFVLVISVAFGRGASRPAKRLSRAAMAIQEGDLDAVDHLPRSRLREMDIASMSFNSMVEGLRERKVIRDLFGKFVPESVAAALVRSPDGLAPQSTEATVLFVDLADFTAIAERMAPPDIIDLLNEYFTELVAIIESEGGVITQFQGDAILAVFNVPHPLPDHAARAVEAARAIQRAVAEKTFLGHRLACRVGVNTGPLVAGNVGASGRMNYTVHGDAVNLAARLEQLNKEHGTAVLLSESTARQAGDNFPRIGTIPVRGRADPVTVYTL